MTFTDSMISSLNKVKIKNIIIEKVSSLKFLVINIDEQLSWKDHISYIINIMHVHQWNNRHKFCYTVQDDIYLVKQ